MKKKKINKKSIIILSIIILIILIEIINPIKLYNKHVLKQLNYSNSSAETILKFKLKDDILKNKYNEALDIILASKEYQNDNYKIYKELNYYEINNYVSLVNSLIKKGYHAKDINNILKNSKEDEVKSFLENDYDKDISKYLQYDFSLLRNYNRYKEYYKKESLDYEDVVVQVNIGLDKEYYTDYNEIKKFSKTMLINKYNGLVQDFVPDDLILVDEEYAVDKKQKGNKEMVEAFIKMSDDCFKEIGSKVLIRSGYRDYKSQEDTYNLYLKTYGKKYAEEYVAHPGFSEHQTGLAIDIKAESSNTFEGTKESKWLLENAYKYGFILRYSKNTEDITGYNYESWHYRYLGVELATKVKESKLTYDEYYIRNLNK